MSYQYRNPTMLPDGRINCEVLFAAPHPLAGEWRIYTADPDDPDPRSIGRSLHAAALLDPNIEHKFPSPEEVEGALAQRVRSQRDGKLRETDWTQLPDVPAVTRAAFVVYRQALRDLPSQPGFPKTVVWPAAPVA
ncbi:MAG: hypothetical protein DI556_09870 [Rhodovulum sulfidophilum]|uniref:Phage tail assembly chaperone-like domain-containing protein n=1 Tax=Rhodovulum sulfidophilum TaxID=35806 RepID=A0A2W5NB45_RHOSU|nr:MAG: hypothetical protein DI556_09870 [Rhodovulum sulfidophilum]